MTETREVNKLSQATRLIEAVEKSGARVFRSQTGEAFTALGGRTFQVKSESFKAFLSSLFYKESGTVAGANALNDAVTTLCGRALFDSPEENIYCRVAHWNGKIILDLANSPHFQVLVIGADGTEIRTDCPIKFVRHAGMQALPVPEGGFDLCNELKPLLNCSSDDFKMTVAWLLSTLQPGGAYPILQVSGEQGSSKTSTAKLLRSLVDPNEAPARGPARSERDVAVSAG